MDTEYKFVINHSKKSVYLKICLMSYQLNFDCCYNFVVNYKFVLSFSSFDTHNNLFEFTENITVKITVI